ncbi:hypothetical protein LJR084_001875 [Variovorax sp. LjRoot84]|uniref:hypothetical protein n=1 Tax=Variovorax sp. LjRoot84 TaxID=3342340 RepID=UPI003ECF53BE
MNAATYHVTTPAQLQRHREQKAAEREALVRTIERSRWIAQSMGVKLQQDEVTEARIAAQDSLFGVLA